MTATRRVRRVGYLPRRSHGGVRVTQRDLSVLYAIAKAGGTSVGIKTYHLVPLVLPASTCARRLRRLHDAGLVRLWSDGPGQAHRVVVDRAGYRLLIDEESINLPRPRSALRPLSVHRDLIVSAWAALCQQYATGWAELVWWRFEWEFDRGAAKFRPDAVHLIKQDGEQYGIAVEVDCGTQRPAHVARKAERLLREGLRIGDVGVHTLYLFAPSVRRLRQIGRALSDPPSSLWLGVLDGQPAELADRFAKTFGPATSVLAQLDDHQ